MKQLNDVVTNKYRVSYMFQHINVISIVQENSSSTN
jgi:hypothetical protein